MAQWRGQFSGYTHSTLVKDYESLLRKLVADYHSRPEDEKPLRLSTLRASARRVQRARLKYVHARLAIAQSGGTMQACATETKQIQNCHDRIKLLNVGGPDAILREFGVKT